MSDGAEPGGAGRKDHRPDGGRQRDVLLRAGRGRRGRDFGYSLARGFEIVPEHWDELATRTSAAS